MNYQADGGKTDDMMRIKSSHNLVQMLKVMLCN